MVRNLVYCCWHSPSASATPSCVDTVHKPDPRFGLYSLSDYYRLAACVQMTCVIRLRSTLTLEGPSTIKVRVNGLLYDFKAAVGGVTFCICEGTGHIYISSFFVKRKKDVESVGYVAQSEKSAEKCLTEKGHFSTASDIALLMNAHRRDFPDYFNLFSRMKTHAGLREVKHSGVRLLGEIDNTIAVKTGFTRASGFSGVVITSDEERTITTVAMGRYTTPDLVDKLRELIGAAIEPTR